MLWILVVLLLLIIFILYVVFSQRLQALEMEYKKVVALAEAIAEKPNCKTLKSTLNEYLNKAFYD